MHSCDWLIELCKINLSVRYIYKIPNLKYTYRYHNLIIIDTILIKKYVLKKSNRFETPLKYVYDLRIVADVEKITYYNRYRLYKMQGRIETIPEPYWLVQ